MRNFKTYAAGLCENIKLTRLRYTGAGISGFSTRVFEDLELPSVGTIKILTPSTNWDSPHECDLFDVQLCLVANGLSHPFLNSQVIASDGWHPSSEEGIEGLIGRDVLKHAALYYHGPGRTFTFGF